MIISDYQKLAPSQKCGGWATGLRKFQTSPAGLGVKAFALLIAISYFDAVVGGGISEMLHSGYWSPIDQKINDMYQAGFGFGVILIMAMLIMRKNTAAILCAPLLVFYCEDTFYYLLQPLASPVIDILIGTTTPAIRFPEHFSGWLGWILRVGFQDGFSFSMVEVILLNVIGVAISGIGLSQYARRK